MVLALYIHPPPLFYCTYELFIPIFRLTPCIQTIGPDLTYLLYLAWASLKPSTHTPFHHLYHHQPLCSWSGVPVQPYKPDSSVSGHNLVHQLRELGHQIPVLESQPYQPTPSAFPLHKTTTSPSLDSLLWS